MTPERYNVVVIAADTVRPDHLSCYGYRHQTSPNVDRLAGEGARFADFQAAQIPTHPAFTTLFTGVDPLYHGILSHSGERQLSPRVLTLAERLQRAGYLTMGIDNMMAMQAAPSWFARGFDYFRVYRYSPGTGEAEKLTNWALRFLDLARDAAEPFFLFVHYFDPHTPYLPPAPFRRRFYQGDEYDPSNTSLRQALADDRLTPLLLGDLPVEEITDFDFVVAQYDGEIAFMDAGIGRIFEAIDRYGLRERTLVVFLSDHGEAFGEGGLYFDHHTLHDAVTRCALIARLPGVIPAGTVIGSLVSSVDVAPTILELTGLPPIELTEVAGCSIRPLFSGARSIRDDAPLGEATRQVSRGIVTPEWRLIEPVVETADGRPIPDFRGRPRSPEVQLFHRRSDREERNDVARDYPSVVADLRGRIQQRLATCAAITGAADPFEHCYPTLPYDQMVEKFEQRSRRR